MLHKLKNINLKSKIKQWFRFDFWKISKIVILAIFALFLLYPFGRLFYRAIFDNDNKFTLEYFKQFTEYKYYYQTLFRSLFVSTITTILAIVIGVPLAYITSRYKIHGKKLINMMIVMSLMSPPFIGAYAWIMLLGRSGIITKFMASLGVHIPSIYGMGGILLVFTLKLFPYVYLYVSGALSSIDASLEEAAENLGMNKIRRILSMTFPIIMPTIAAGAVMVFMTSLADFGTPMLLGEGFKVLPVLVYEQYVSEMSGNYGLAAALSVIIVTCSLTVLIIQKRIVNKRTYVMSALRPPVVMETRLVPKIILSLISFTVAFVSFLPQIVVIYISFLNTVGPIFADGFSLKSYQEIFFRLGNNIKNTFMLSSIAIVLIVIIGVIIAYLTIRRKSKSSTLLDLIVMFPYVIPGAVLGISLILSFNNRPLLLVGSAAIMVIAYVVRKMPFTVRSASAILQQIDPSVEEASISLGVSPMKSFFNVTARLMIPGIVSGAILSWISTINELSSSIMLYTGRTATISVAVYTEVVRASYGTAAALASILTVTTIISFILFHIISKGKISVV